MAKTTNKKNPVKKEQKPTVQMTGAAALGLAELAIQAKETLRYYFQHWNRAESPDQLDFV